MEVLRGLRAEDDDFEDALGGPAGRRIGAVRAGGPRCKCNIAHSSAAALRRRAARFSLLTALWLRREMEVLRGLRAEDDDFEERSWSL